MGAATDACKEMNTNLELLLKDTYVLQIAHDRHKIVKQVQFLQSQFPLQKLLIF